jgi:hypothetical protein
VYATLLRYPDPEAEVREPGPHSAVLRPAGGGTVSTALGPDLPEVRRLMARDGDAVVMH